jgi:outer membrane receptor protein involved in Fe transport
MHALLKTTLLLLASISLHCFSFAQSGKKTITGLVMDSSNQKPLQFATVALYKSRSLTQPIKMAPTNDKGKFVFNGVDTGKYTVLVSYAGYAQRQQAITVLEDSMDMGAFFLTASGTLSGVTVQARKLLIEQQDDKIIFNVENDPAAKTENATDILRKTPFVSVDGDGNVQVNGQSNFRVLLNGRETAMFSRNVKEALKGFPGAMITRIEVITSPSAKYDAEGVGGIINIITQKKVLGYSGYLSANYGTNGLYSGSTSFNAKFGKVGFTLNYSASANTNIRGRSLMETVPFVPTTFQRRTLAGSRFSNNFFNFGNGELSWEVDSLNTVAVYSNINDGNAKADINQVVTRDYNSAPDTNSYYKYRNNNQYPSKNIGADFIRKFKGNKEKEWSVRFNSQLNNNNASLNSVMDNDFFADNYTINNSFEKNREFTLQSDYIQPLLSSRKVEAGVKAILRRASSDFESRFRTDLTEAYKLNVNNSDNFTYNQDVYSAYGTYSFRVKKTSLRLGARIEHTEVLGDFVSSKEKIKQDYTNLLPNLLATIRLNAKYTFIASYTQRIQRPSISSLNPFKFNNDPYNVAYGNPNLDAQLIHSLSLQTRIIKGTTFAAITLSGNYSNNKIIQYTSFDKTTGITTSTTDNLGKELQVGINANLNGKLNADWSLNLNGGLRYHHIKNRMIPTQANGGLGGNISLYSNYTISKRISLNGNFSFSRTAVSLQTQYPVSLWYGTGVNYKMLKDKLSLSLSVVNFFQKERDYKTITSDSNFRNINITTVPFRNFFVGLTWGFGKLRENVSKKKGVLNDDQITVQ